MAYIGGIKKSYDGVMYGEYPNGDKPLTGVLNSTLANAIAYIVGTIPAANSSYYGIPDPDFGSVLGNPTTVTKQSIPSPWTSNTSGQYYVEQGGTNSGNGYPADPSGTIPSTLSAGDILVLSGTFTGGDLVITCSGTETNPIWIINDGIVDIQRDSSIAGTYTMVDGIYWSSLDYTFLDHGSNSSYICVRNGAAVGNGVHDTAHHSAYSVSGSSGNDNHHIVLYNFDISYFGDYTDNGLYDMHQIKARNNIQDFWVLNCHLHHGGGDGVQTGEASGVTGTDRPTRIYVGGCEMNHNRENSLDIKPTINCVISQCNLHDSQGLGDSGPGQEVVIHGQSPAPVDGVFAIFNYIHDTKGAIAASDYSNYVYVAGNIFDTVLGATGDTWFGAGVCVLIYGGSSSFGRVSNNTFYNYNKGISAPSDGAIVQITGNLFDSRTGTYNYDIGIDATGGVYFVDECDYNLFESARFYHDGSYYNGLGSVPGGYEANSIEGTTGLNSPSTGDFTLTASSDAINNGIKGNLYSLYYTEIGVNIEIDYAGDDRPVTSTDWDIGAHEY